MKTRTIKGAFAKEHGAWVDGSSSAKAGQVWHTSKGVYRCKQDTTVNPDSDTEQVYWSKWLDKTDVNDAVTTVNALIDAWVQTNPVAGMSRIDGDSDPAAETLYGAAQVREIGKHLRLKVMKNGEVVKTAAAGRLTLATNGEIIAIDGTEGDVMLGFDCDTHLLKASEEIDSVKHNMMGVSLAPASWQGHVSKKFRPWAITPCETVHAQLSDDVRSQAHCIYNTSVAGSYSTPSALFAEKLYANGGGLRTVSESLRRGLRHGGAG